MHHCHSGEVAKRQNQQFLHPSVAQVTEFGTFLTCHSAAQELQMLQGREVWIAGQVTFPSYVETLRKNEH